MRAIASFFVFIRIFICGFLILVSDLSSPLASAQYGGGSYAPPLPDSPIDVLDYNDQGVDIELRAHNKDLLGDSISSDTGALSFRHVDVSIPGNSHLPVVFARYLDSGKERLGDGKEIAGGASGTTFRDAAQKADAYGGEAGDYVKVSSDAYVTPDGMSLSTHAVQNQKTGEIFEPKSIINERAKK